MIDLTILQCPHCQARKFRVEATELTCAQCISHFPFSRGRPVLVDPANQLFRPESYADATPRGAHRRWAAFSPSVNLSRDRTLARLAEALSELESPRVLVVGAGNERAALHRSLQVSPSVGIVCTDVDPGADVDAFCDAHQLPFASGTFDALITTAVLEHVMYPERAASEISRVLKPGGWLYSELPFMQQVHEGAYDFTRFTLSGHRRLFGQFAIHDAGMVSGPGTALVWSIESFATAFFAGRWSSLIVKAAARASWSWLKYADHLLQHRAQALDGACCTFVFGRKAPQPATDAEVVASYAGRTAAVRRRP